MLILLLYVLAHFSDEAVLGGTVIIAVAKFPVKSGESISYDKLSIIIFFRLWERTIKSSVFVSSSKS